MRASSVLRGARRVVVPGTRTITVLASVSIGLWGPAIGGFGSELVAQADTSTREQVVLTGRVVDAATSQPVHGAFVGIKFGDWGMLTDHDGRFRLEVDRMPNYLLAAENLGYKPAEMDVLDSVRGQIVLRLEADPVQLGEIRIMVDRFSSRRKASSLSVRAFERADLLTSPSMNMLDYLRGRTGRPLRECPFRSAFGRVCIMSRGRVQPIQLYLDEMPVFGGLDELRGFQPHELFMVEVYDSGRHIRLYSTQFMDRLARSGLRLNPIPIND